MEDVFDPHAEKSTERELLDGRLTELESRLDHLERLWGPIESSDSPDDQEDPSGGVPQRVRELKEELRRTEDSLRKERAFREHVKGRIVGVRRAIDELLMSLMDSVSDK